MENWRRFLDEECEDDEVEQIAQVAHKGQTRRGGEEYITHPKEVARLAAQYGYDELIQSVAMLHDTLEDYDDVVEMEKYIKEACPEALPIVKELTHAPGSDYTEYVLSLSSQALQVKLLDMLHNSADLTPDKKQYVKYQTALQALVDRDGGPPSALHPEHWKAISTQLGVQ